MKEGDIVIFVYFSVDMTYGKQYIVRGANKNQHMLGFVTVLSDSGKVKTFNNESFITLSEHRERLINIILDDI